MKSIIRAFFGIFICLGAVFLIVFLIIVDIFDDAKRDQRLLKMTDTVLKDSLSAKPSEGD